MTITNGYATLAAAKSFLLPEASTDAADDVIIESIIESVSRLTDAQTCRRFYKDATDATQYFTPQNAAYLEVPDLISITSLNTDDGGLRTYSWSWAATDYDLWPYNAALEGRPYRRIDIAPSANYTFPAGIAKSVKIVGKFGWPAIPQDINQACLVGVKAFYNSRFGQNVSGTATVTGAGVVISPRDMPAEFWTLINPYRLRR